MRDWRRDESREMDPELIDLIWTLREELGSKEPVKLISAYRSATTNNKLRRKGGGQAKNSQHIQGKAADIQFPDVPVKTLRNSALIQEWGGVGYYPDLRHSLRACRHRPRAHVAAHRPPRARGALPRAARPNICRSTASPSRRKDYQLAMAKGLPGRNTLLASVRPAPKPAVRARAVQTAAYQPSFSLCSATSSSLRSRTSRSRRKRCSPLTCLMRLSPPLVASAPQSRPRRCPSASARLCQCRRRSAESEAAIESPNFPLYQSAEVVGAPEADEDHPDETSYVPFEIAGLMSDISITYNHVVAR